MNTKTPIPDINELFRLAAEDPKQLEKLHKQLVNKLIESAPEDKQQRLRGLQFQIDMEARKHDNPMGKCVAISKLMMESLAKLNSVLNGAPEVVDRKATQAEVINLFNTTK